jgi:Methylamine utilisation protein MauE
MMIDPAIGCLIAACIGLLFMVAAVHKLRDLRRFREVFTAYRLVPAAVARRIACVVPAVELVVAAELILGAPGLALATGSVLLLGYAAAIAVNLARGRSDLDCGCAGPDNRRPIAAWMVWRNVVIAMLSAVALLPWTERPLALTDGVTVGFGTACCALIYLCVDRLSGVARHGFGRAAAGPEHPLH